MGNQQGTAESLDCSKELDRIEYQLNEYERQAGNKLESNVVIDAKELALLKHNLEKIQINQLDTLHDRYTMDKNLKSRRKVLTKRLLAFLARVDAKEKLMNLIPGSTAAIHNGSSGEHKTDTVGSIPPSLCRQPSAGTTKCNDYLDGLSEELATIEVRICDIFANHISPDGTHIC